MSVNDALQEHWGIYEEMLREAGFQTPYEWYTQQEFLRQSGYSIAEPDNPRWGSLHDCPLHVLYRIMGYTGQPYAFVMHNPAVALREVGANEGEINSYEDEIGQLSRFREVEPVKFGEVCCPNWTRYIRDNIGGNGALNNDGTWDKRAGVVFTLLEKYAQNIHIPEDRSEYFEGEKDSAPFFQDFYYTNVFKLPTPTGEGSSSFKRRRESGKFYEALAQEELAAADVDVAFLFGRAAKDSLLSEAKLVANGQGEPVGKGKDRHGFLYTAPSNDTHYLALVHPAYTGSPPKRNQETLESNVRYLAEQGVL